MSSTAAAWTGIQKGILLLVSACLAACGSSSSPSSQGFAHCMSRSVLSDSNVSVGSTRLRIEEGVLTISGARTPLVVAAFQGPGLDDQIMDAAFAEVKATSPAVVVVLGGLGDDGATAIRTARSLAAMQLPVLVVPGGRDEEDVLESAFDSLEGNAEERVLDASRLQKIILGAAAFIPVAGSPNGRYARTSSSCGFAQTDLDARDDALGRAGNEHRFLLSWAAPRGEGPRRVARALEGTDAGDPMLHDFASRVGARGGVFAWPSDGAMLPTPHDGSRILSRSEASSTFQMVVPSVARATPRSDGSSVRAGFALIEVRNEGLAFVGP